VNKLKLLKRMGYGRADLHSYVSECFMLSETITCFGAATLLNATAWFF
jgi:hypothetical protein